LIIIVLILQIKKVICENREKNCNCMDRIEMMTYRSLLTI